MGFQVQFVRFRLEDNRPTPVGLPAQVVARTADEAMTKLKRLVDDGKWPQAVDAARLLGREMNSYIRPVDLAAIAS